MIGDADCDHVMTIHYVCYHKSERTGDDLVQTFNLTTREAYEEWVDTVAPESA